MRRRSAVLCCVLTLVVTGSAAADTLTATETTLSSGFLTPYGGSGSVIQFTNALLTFSYTGDAGKTYFNNQNGSYNSSNFGGSLTITVAGLGTDTFLSAEAGSRYGETYETDLSSGSAKTVGSIGGYSQSADGQGSQSISTTATSGPYTLTSSFGPITGSSSYFVGGFTGGYPAFGFSTGYLEFTSFDPAITYQATVTPTAMTPEPYSLLLVATGVCGLASTARRRYACTRPAPPSFKKLSRN